MNEKEMTKIAKECGCKVSELPELKCPSEFDYTYDLEECPGEYIGDICEECWKNAEKPDPDDTVYRLTKKAFDSDKEYMEYLKRCADVEPVQPVTEQVHHPTEEWKDVVGFEMYEVSSLGKIRNKETGYIKTPGVGKRGYPVVSMRRDGKMYLKTVHRIVANAFIPNPEDKPEVNHINGDKTDYRIENLEWTTTKENNAHARRTGLHKSDGDKAVNQYDEFGRLIATYRSASVASRITGISRSCICNVCHNRSYNGKTHRTAGGYVWKWAK